MGGACVCNNQIINECSLFWSRVNIRKITFQEYVKIFADKRSEWLKCLNKNNEFTIEISECEILRDILNSPDFSDKERTFFFEKLKKFISKQQDKLLFFTSLSFFTLPGELQKKDSNNTKNESKNKKFCLGEEAKNYIESLKVDTKKEDVDIISEQLLKMSIKRDEHNDVTKIFIELVSEFTVDLLNLEPRSRKELSFLYEQEVREILFSKLMEKPKKMFYEYMFNEKNVKFITDDLTKIYRESSSDSKKDMNESGFFSSSLRSENTNTNNDKNIIKVDLSKIKSADKNKKNYYNNNKAEANVIKAENGIGRI